MNVNLDFSTDIPMYSWMIIPDYMKDPLPVLTPVFTPTTLIPSTSSMSDPSSDVELSPLSESARSISAEEAERIDKRLRNTAASARFREKKKARESELQKIVIEMTAKKERLEEREKELQQEISWLKALVMETNTP